MRLDSHCHIWDLTIRDVPQLRGLPEINRSCAFGEFQALLEEERFDGAIVVQALPSIDESLDLLAESVGNPYIKGVCGWIDVHATDAARTIHLLRSAPGGSHLRALRYSIQSEHDDAWSRDRLVLDAVRCVGVAGAAFELLIREDQLSAATSLVRSTPGTRFILDHGAKPRQGRQDDTKWERELRAMAALPNVAAKLSGSLLRDRSGNYAASTARRYAEVVLSAFGPERSMFGGEWPVCLTSGTYNDVVHNLNLLIAGLTPSQRRAVLGGTASGWFGLGNYR